MEDFKTLIINKFKFEEAAMIISWFGTVRLFSIFFIWIACVNQLFFGSDDSNFYILAILVTPLYFLVSFALFILFKGQEGKRWYNFIPRIQLTADVIFITLIIYFSGGASSGLVFLYIIPVLSAGMLSILDIIIGPIIILSVYFLMIYLGGAGWNPFVPMNQNIFEFHSPYATGIIPLIVISAFSSYYYFSHLKRKDKELLNLKDQFLFTAVHDVRSPLTLMSLILDKYAQPDLRERYPEIQEDIVDMKKGISQILELTNDLMSLAKEKNIVIKKKAVDTVCLMEDILKEWQPALQNKSINIEFTPTQDTPPVLADERKLKEVFTNLISNAIKYNNNGGKITIFTAQEGDVLKIKISDTGIGMPADKISNIFNPYFRIDSSKQVPGTGLGLYIVKRFVDQMDGKIEVTSSVGVGSSFTVILPIVK